MEREKKASLTRFARRLVPNIFSCLSSQQYTFKTRLNQKCDSWEKGEKKRSNRFKCSSEF